MPSSARPTASSAVLISSAPTLGPTNSVRRYSYLSPSAALTASTARCWAFSGFSFGLASWRWTHGYVENVAHAIVLAIDREEAAGRIYNVGERATPSVAERVGKIAVAAGWRGTIVLQEASKLPPGLVVPLHFDQEIVYDTSRLRRELGYEEPVSEAEALRRTIEWERANPPAPVDPAQFDYEAEDRALRDCGVKIEDRGPRTED